MTIKKENHILKDHSVSKYIRLQQFLQEEGEPPFRFVQLTQAIFKQKIHQFEHMTGLPKRLRQKLAEQFGDSLLDLTPIAQSNSAQAEKVLFQLTGGDKIETVAMKYRAGWESFCISSQSGCGFGCRFCATGAIGLKRNLTADEITDQILYFALKHRSIDSISFMGMGEALANPQTFDAIRLFTDPMLFGLSQRRLTISTIGLIPGIQQLTKSFPQVNLTFSLHSPFDEQRSELMPINRLYPLHDVLEALDEHIEVSRRKVYVAYVILPGVNDTPDHANELIRLFHKRPQQRPLFHLNLIRYNPAPGVEERYRRPSEDSVRQFYQRITAGGLKATVRQSFGMDIEAACGQLYGKYKPKPKSKPKSKE